MYENFVRDYSTRNNNKRKNEDRKDDEDFTILVARNCGVLGFSYMIDRFTSQYTTVRSFCLPICLRFETNEQRRAFNGSTILHLVHMMSLYIQ